MDFNQQHKLMTNFNRLASGWLRQLSILFEETVPVNSLVFRFIIMSNLTTFNVNEVDSYDEAFEWVANIDKAKLSEPNVIAVWPNGIIWQKFELHGDDIIVIDDDVIVIDDSD